MTSFGIKIRMGMMLESGDEEMQGTVEVVSAKSEGRRTKVRRLWA